MTDISTELPRALRRALDLLVDVPADPDVAKGYLDLLRHTAGTESVSKNTGFIQSLWASGIGSMFYDNAQTFARRFVGAWQLATDWLDIPAGGTVLDVGSGPGNVTGLLGKAAGPGGLALGVDISEPMLTRAVAAEAGPQVGFLRADAQRLPFRDEVFDAATSLAVLQLIPDPAVTLAEIKRVLRPGARVAVMVPTVTSPGPVGGAFFKLLPDAGAHFFGEDELGDTFEDLGFTGVRAKTLGNVQWVRATRP